MKQGGFVYIMASHKMGTLYIGSTSDLMARILQHRDKTYKGFTSKYSVDKLVYYEWHDKLTDMVNRERQMKSWKRNWKLKVIIDFNPGWVDLTEDVLNDYGYSLYTSSGSRPSPG